MTMPSSVRFVRVELSYRDRTKSVRFSEEKVWVDMVLDTACCIIGKWELYGRWSEYDGQNISMYPVTVKLNGEVYFCKNDSYSTNLRERKMKKGEFCTFWSSPDRVGEEWIYEVVRIIELGNNL